MCNIAEGCTSCIPFFTTKANTVNGVRSNNECIFNWYGLILLIVVIVLSIMTCVGFCIWKSRTKYIQVKG